jgi:mannose-6-phosphate isomerase
MEPELCPLDFEARLMPKIWGGRRLEHWGKELPSGVLFGESWEVFDDAEGSARCRRGPAAGRSLAEVAVAWGGDFYGPGRGAVHGRFPLLVKLLDAREDLSIQVHPSDELARMLHGPGAAGKRETWVVLEAEPGTRVLNGFKPGTTWPLVREAIAARTMAQLLHSVPVRVGDVIDIPAGRPHALGAGCLVAEVQQNSDWTYRLWDHGRLERGRPRPLHLREAEQALRFDALGCGDGKVSPVGGAQVWGLCEALVSNDCYSVERWTLKPGASALLEGRLRVLLPLSGDPALDWGPGRAERALGPGGTTLVPAGLACRLQAGAAGAELLCVEAR